jgi:hypothetical protein
MRKLISTVAGAVAVVAAALLSTGTANAAYPAVPGWTSPAQMAPVATICFETGGGKVFGPSIVAAAAGWNKSDLTVVAKVSCIDYARRATVKFVAYYNSATNARGYVTDCAKYAGGTYTWVYMRGVWTWVAETPTVMINYAPLATKQCLHSSYAAKTNIVSHETGHYFGLSHATGITVMTSAVGTKYTVATVYDINRVNGRY